MIISLTTEVIPIFSRDANRNLTIKTKVGKPAKVSVTLTSNIDTPVEIGSVTHTFGEKADVSVDTIEPGKKYQVTLTSNARTKVKWSGRIQLALQGAPQPAMALPAFIEVKE
jgi:hypothetical protein